MKWVISTYVHKMLQHVVGSSHHLPVPQLVPPCASKLQAGMGEGPEETSPR